MAASTEVLAAKDLIVKAGATIIGGQDEATLNWNVNSTDLAPKMNNNWRKSLVGLKGWSIDIGGLWYEGTPADRTRGFGSSLGIRDVGGTSYTNLSGLSSLTFALNLATRQVANQDHADWLVELPDLKSSTISVEADYIDPNATNGAALGKVLTAFENGNDLEFKYSFGAQGSSFVGTVMPVPGSITAADGNATIGFDLEAQGVVTETLSNADAGLSALLAAFFASPPTELTAEFGVILDKTQTAYTPEYDLYSGPSYLTSFTLDNPADGPLRTSGTLTGSGALDRAQVPTPV